MKTIDLERYPIDQPGSAAYRRLLERWYGRAFFDSLPPVRIEAEPLMDLLPTLGRYVG